MNTAFLFLAAACIGFESSEPAENWEHSLLRGNRLLEELRWDGDDWSVRVCHPDGSVRMYTPLKGGWAGMGGHCIMAS